MRRTRRQFIKEASVAAVAGPTAVGLAMQPDPDNTEKKLKILFLGGTGFLGPRAVRYAVERGHEVTLFNRGSRADLFPDLEHIAGNRITDVEPGLDPLKTLVAKGRRWDAVVDTASVHTWVANSAEVLADSADQYMFVSSLSVYADSSEGRTEDDEVAAMPDEVADTIDRLPYDMRYYGAVKARSEAAAEQYFPGRATVVRPGLIVGPGDRTHRFTYWPLRVRRGGEVLAPGNTNDPVMFIDVRDLAEFMVRLLEQKNNGIFNANGPAEPGMTIGRLLAGCRDTTQSDAKFTWVDAGFLAERGINGWMQMPVWINPVGEYKGFHHTSIERARKAGLTTRPLDDTVRATLAWFDEWAPDAERAKGWTYKPGVDAPGISRQQETDVLAEWHRHNG